MKQEKKEAAKQEKLRRHQEQEAAATASRSQTADAEDSLSGNYGDLLLVELQSMRIADVNDWTEVGALTNALKDKKVQIRGRAQTIRAVGKNMAFIVVREKGFTVQCVATVQPEVVSRQMVKYVVGLSRQSIIDIEGIVFVPDTEIKSATQQVQVRKLYCISRAAVLPINVEDAARSDAEIERASQDTMDVLREASEAESSPNMVLDSVEVVTTSTDSELKIYVSG